MRTLYDKINDLKCGWNERPIDEDVILALCRKRKIKLQFMPLTVKGFYTCSTRGHHFIAVDPRLTPLERLVVLAHEFGHYLMHSPSQQAVDYYCGSAVNDRDELEADTFAYCAVLPVDLLRTGDPEELGEMYGTQFLLRRLEIYERFQV